MHTLREIIQLARERSPFFERLYRDLPNPASFEDLPILDVSDYWTAHRQAREEVLTGPLIDGVVLNSGGTTGTPKFSYFNDQEWDDAVTLSAHAFSCTGLQDGDRVANLFAVGDLYSSFLFATESMKVAAPRILQFPLAYSMNFAAVATAVRGFDINVLAGFPTHLLRVIDYLDRDFAGSFDVRRILFAGEMFSPDQEAFLRGRFPGISIRSVGYATIDAGLIGFADESCTLAEHRVFDGSTIVEIVDEETGELIDAPRQPGRVVFTSCTRRLMPMLRYPTGDRAEWVEPAGTPNRRFALLGRSGESTRVASFTLPLEQVRGLLEPFRETLGIEAFQLMVTREDLRDRLTIRAVGKADPEVLKEGSRKIVAAFAQRQPELAETITAGIMHPMVVDWARRGDLITNPKTGKLQMIVDRRGSAE